MTSTYLKNLYFLTHNTFDSIDEIHILIEIHLHSMS